MAKDTETDWGCAAVGQSGGITISVDEALSDPERWELTVDYPCCYFRFAIAGPHVIAEFLAFLQREWNGSHAELTLGKVGDATISIVEDDAFVDRFFVRASAADGTICHTFKSEEVDHCLAALKTAKADLDNTK